MTMIEIQAQTLPAWLRATRGALGLSTRAIGETVGVSHATVSAWERGKGEPSVTQFVLWCRATQQRPDQMIEALAELIERASQTGESLRGYSVHPPGLEPGTHCFRVDEAFWAIVERIEVTA